MIISRTPFRISFAGGGTDLRSFYDHEPGQVLSTSIDKYLYVVVRRQVGFVEFKYRVNYSKVEFRHTIDEIEHPIVREALKMFRVDVPLEITTFADIPSSTGLGSSSAFAVGLVHALSALKGKYVTKSALANEAAYIEINRLERTMGKQDHFASAYGNLNVFTFSPRGVGVEPIFARHEAVQEVQDCLMLFYTGLKRDASEVLQCQEKNADLSVLRRMKEQVGPLRRILSGKYDLTEIGRILHEGWMLKKTLTPEISSPQIDLWYEAARNAGAVGGKLLGAGGGGFLLFFVEPQHQLSVARALGLFHLPFRFDTAGSRITYYDQ